MVKIQIRQSTKCHGNYSLYISFPYNQNLVSIMRSLPSKYWHKEEKCWEVPEGKLDYLREVLDGKYAVKVIDEREKDTNNTVSIPDTFTFKTEPFAHQIEGVKYGLTHQKWLLGDDPGLGKTKQVIDIAVIKKTTLNYSHCLIVCCVNGLKWNWAEEIKKHSDENVWILGQRKKRNKLVIGSMKDRLADLSDLAALSSYFLVTNIETLRDQEIASRLAWLCAHNEINIVAVDEVHKCKNPSSQQSKGLLKLKPAEQIPMTGTPLLNSPLDLYFIFKWIGEEKHSFYSFKNHYCIMGGFGGHEIMGYRYLDELQDRLNSIMLRRKKEDVLDLPDKLYVTEYVEMTKPQEQIYNEVKTALVANIDKIKLTHNPLSEFIRLRQATGYTGILSTTVQVSAKIDRMAELVEDTVQSGQKAVIFTNWEKIATPAYKKLRTKYDGILITGATSDNDRQMLKNKFQTDPDCKFAMGTLGALGTGFTLTAGSVVIFLDEPWTMGNKQQAIDRCHRIGTTQSITVYTILCKNTVDERVHDIVENKGILSDAIVDGEYAGNKSELVDFLLS